MRIFARGEDTESSFRHESRVAIRKDKEPPISLKQISDVWDFAKDGKQYLRKATLAKFPELMRKYVNLSR